MTCGGTFHLPEVAALSQIGRHEDAVWQMQGTTAELDEMPGPIHSDQKGQLWRFWRGRLGDFLESLCGSLSLLCHFVCCRCKNNVAKHANNCQWSSRKGRVWRQPANRTVKPANRSRLSSPPPGSTVWRFHGFTAEPWNRGTVEPWNRAVGPWNRGTEPWNRGTVKPWNRTVEPWNRGTVKPWNRTVEPWNRETVEPWNRETEPWNRGTVTVEPWNPETEPWTVEPWNRTVEWTVEPWDRGTLKPNRGNVEPNREWRSEG